MSRATRWRRQCPDAVAALVAPALTDEFYVVAENGPTSFVIKSNPTSRQKYRVSIGENQTCSCTSSGPRELCVHILFVMLKIFRVPRDNPLAWQTSLVPSEIDQILAGRYRPPPVQNVVTPGGDGSSNIGGHVPRREITEEDMCAICYDSMCDQRPSQLVFCRYGCGQNLHYKCMQVYVSSHQGKTTPLSCPLCRTSWGTWLPPPKTEHTGVSCRHCRAAPIDGARYKCAFCVSYDLCETCFNDSLLHPQHPFNVATEPGADFVPADRSRATPSVRVNAMGNALQTITRGNVPAHLQELLYRDLTDADYEALTALDDAVPAPASRVLSDEMAAAIPATEWMSSGTPALDCVVCLCPMQSGDSVKALPSCSHAFHAGCIDRWLTESRAICPVCTGPVVVSEAQMAAAKQQHNHATATTTTAVRRRNTNNLNSSKHQQQQQHDALDGLVTTGVSIRAAGGASSGGRRVGGAGPVGPRRGPVAPTTAAAQHRERARSFTSDPLGGGLQGIQIGGGSTITTAAAAARGGAGGGGARGGRGVAPSSRGRGTPSLSSHHIGGGGGGEGGMSLQGSAVRVASQLRLLGR